jgi:hypothetical protein
VEDISNDVLQEYIINLNNARVKKETIPKWGTIFISPISFQTTNRNYSIPINKNRKKGIFNHLYKKGPTVQCLCSTESKFNSII